MLAIQIDGPRAGECGITIHWRFTDSGDEYRLTLRNGVLTHRTGTPKGDADATVSVDRAAINEVLAGHVTLPELAASGRLSIDGDQSKLGELLALLDPPDPNFPIVTP